MINSFQEQQFTKRSLVFAGGQVIFRCLRADQWREDVVFEDESTISGESPRGDDRVDDIGEFEGLFQSYSGLSLTYQEDIYNAFSGIARYIKMKLDVDLCHGIPDAFFDWFLLWGPLKPQERRLLAPSWSWSGWTGDSWPRVWDWYSRSIKKIRRALRNRTWIIWYQRVAHNSTECVRVWSPQKRTSSSSPRNFYGSHVINRFQLDTTRTDPTPRTLLNAPVYYKDVLNSNPRSGFLQFWTVSLRFRLDAPTSKEERRGPAIDIPRVGFYGRDGRELGVLMVNEGWCKAHVPGEHEFIILCEGRAERPQGGREDQEEGWKYMVMLIEWHSDGQWAERVSVGSIEKNDVNQGLGQGPEWKEIVLG